MEMFSTIPAIMAMHKLIGEEKNRTEHLLARAVSRTRLMGSSFIVSIIGAITQLTGLTWLYLLYSFIVVYLGGLLQFPEWMANLSPFGHVPQIPVEDMDFMKVMVLTVIAVVITIIGFIAYNKRDIHG